MAEELNQKRIETHKHIMLAFKMDSATKIGLVNIFYSINNFVFNNNQFTGKGIQKHDENTNDINLLLVKTKTTTDAYIITNININTDKIGGEITHIGGQDKLRQYFNNKLIEGIPEMYVYIKQQLDKQTNYEDSVAPIINLFNLINDQTKIYQTLYKPIVFKISSLDINTIVGLKSYIYKGDYIEYDGKQFEGVLNKFIEFSYITFTNTDINENQWIGLLDSLGGLSDFQSRIEKDKQNYKLYYKNEPHIVMHITNFIEFISILSKNNNFIMPTNRDTYNKFDIAIYINMQNIFKLIEIIDNEFTIEKTHSIQKTPEGIAEDINDILNDKLNQESSNNIITYLKINNTETVIGGNNKIDHAKKRAMYNQRFSLGLNQETYKSGDQTKQKSTLLKLGYNDDEFPYYTCTNNTAAITETNMAEFRKHPKKFTLPQSGNGIVDINYKYKYYFGKFQEVFPLYSGTDTNPISNQEISSRMDSVKSQLLLGKPVFIIGYGASGAGKTSTLINYNGEDGILIHLCKNLIGNNFVKKNFNKLGIIVKEYYVNTEPLVSDEYIFSVDDKTKDFLYLNRKTDNGSISLDSPVGDGDDSIKPKHQYRVKDDFKLDQATKLGELLVHLVDLDRLVKATTNNSQSSRSHTLIFVKLYEEKANIGNLIIGDFAGVENKFRCDDTITLKKFLDMPNKNKKPFYSDLLNIKEGGGGNMSIMSKETVSKDMVMMIDPDTKQTNIETEQDLKFSDKLTCKPSNITSADKLYDFKPSNLIYRDTLPVNLQDFKPKEIKNNQIELQQQNQKKENERARKTLEVVLKQLIPAYPENYKDTKEVYDYLIQDDVTSKINENMENMKKNFTKITEVRDSSILKDDKQITLLTYLVYKYLFFNENADVNTENMTEIKNEYTANMKTIKREFIDPKKHAVGITNDSGNIHIIANHVINAKPEYPYNDQYKNDLIDFANRSPIRNESLSNPTTNMLFHGFSYNANAKDQSQQKYKTSFNGIFNSYSFDNIHSIIKTMILEFKTYYEIYNKDNTTKPGMNLQRYDFFGIDESFDIMQGAKIPVWFQGNINQFAKIFMDKEFSVFKEFLVSINYKNPTEQFCFILDILADTDTEIDKFKEFVEYMKTVIDETICRLKHSQIICDRRLQEGVYINTTLSIIRKTIKQILFVKHKLSNAVMHSPNIIDMCLKSYCPTQQNCFAFEEQDDSDDDNNHNLIDEIHKTLYNSEDKDNFYRDITICLFGVFNISRCANNPPPIQYIDINRLKQIAYSKQEQSSIIQPVFEKLQNDIKRFNMEYLNTYGYLTDVLLPKLGINKAVDDITYSKMTEDGSTYKNDKTIKAIIEEIINEIDTSNAASAVGVLEFLDQMTKFSTSNTLCFLENDKHDLVKEDDIQLLNKELYTYGHNNTKK
jgi:hypothetical protein